MGNSAIDNDKKSNTQITIQNDVLIGFINTNNTCYINSIVQSLYWIKPFREQILFLPNNLEKNTTLKGLHELFEIISKKKKSEILDIRDFVNIIKRNKKEFNNDDHHDAHEFLIWILDNLEQNSKNEHLKNKKINQVLLIHI